MCAAFRSDCRSNISGPARYRSFLSLFFREAGAALPRVYRQARVETPAMPIQTLSLECLRFEYLRKTIRQRFDNRQVELVALKSQRFVVIGEMRVRFNEQIEVNRALLVADRSYRASGTSAAKTGRTRDRTRPMLQSEPVSCGYLLRPTGNPTFLSLMWLGKSNKFLLRYVKVERCVMW